MEALRKESKGLMPGQHDVGSGSERETAPEKKKRYQGPTWEIDTVVSPWAGSVPNHCHFTCCLKSLDTCATRAHVLTHNTHTHFSLRMYLETLLLATKRAQVKHQFDRKMDHKLCLLIEQSTVNLLEPFLDSPGPSLLTATARWYNSVMLSGLLGP